MRRSLTHRAQESAAYSATGVGGLRYLPDKMPVNVQYLDYEPLGFLSWGLREDGELVEQRAFGPDSPPTDTYAVYTLDNDALRAEFAYPWVIVGAVRPTSAMELGPTGFRCGDAEIVALARSPLWRDDEKRAAERTAQRYRVPLVEFDRLAAVASEHGSPLTEDDRLPSRSEPSTEREPHLEGGPSNGRRRRRDPPPGTAPEAVAAEPATSSRAPPRHRSESHGNVSPRPSVWLATFDPWQRGLSNWLAYCALGAGLVVLGVGVWLMARAGWPSGSLPFLLPAAITIAVASGRRLRVALSAASAGVLAALLYLLVAAGSGETPEEAQVRFAMLVVAWFVAATAFASVLVGAVSRARRCLTEQLAALAAVVLPAAGLVAVGLLNLSAGIGALLIAAVELAALVVWNQVGKRETRRASG